MNHLKLMTAILNESATKSNSKLLRYKSSITKKTAGDGANGKVGVAQIAVPLKYLSNFSRSLEMPLINCKNHLELNWTKNCEMSTVSGDAAFAIIDVKLYVLMVTLSTKDNGKLTKQLIQEFKRSVYWNQYKTIIKSEETCNNNLMIHTSFMNSKLFVLALNDADNES